MLRNGFRRAPIRIVGSGILLALAVIGLVVVFVFAARITALDGPIVGRVIGVLGAEIALAALLLPVMFSRMQLLEPRAFLGYGIRSSTLAAVILLTTVVGPAALVIPLALAPVVAWRGFADAGLLPLLAAPLLVIQLLLLLRVGVALGARLHRHRRARGWVRAFGVVALLGGLGTLGALLLPQLVLAAPERSLAAFSPVVRFLQPLHIERVADSLAGSPIASLWGAPGFAVAGTGRPGVAIWIGVASIVVLALLWWVLVADSLRATRRLNLRHADSVPGWFRGLPPTPAGAVAARSFIYWVRDPRYRVVFGILPLLPIATVVAFWIGGVPREVAAMVPLPLMVLLLAWSTIHNDIAYDSTAMWSHLASQTRGVHDRLGRIWPVVVFGIVLIAIGTPFTVWAQGSVDALPAILGITFALLLGGVGVGSAMSARHPYPAPRPGDGAFTFPQASGGTGGGAQGASFFLTLLVATPPVAATALWLSGYPGPWPLVALGTGLASGLLALLVGVRSGASAFDRRGPELLAFTMQN